MEIEERGETQAVSVRRTGTRILTDEQADQYVNSRRAQQDSAGHSERFDEELKKVAKAIGSTGITVAFGPGAVQSLRESNDSDPTPEITLTPAVPAVSSSSASRRVSRPNLLEQMERNLDLSALLMAEPKLDIHNRRWQDVGPAHGWEQTVEDVGKRTGDLNGHQRPHYLTLKYPRGCASNE